MSDTGVCCKNPKQHSIIRPLLICSSQNSAGATRVICGSVQTRPIKHPFPKRKKFPVLRGRDLLDSTLKKRNQVRRPEYSLFQIFVFCAKEELSRFLTYQESIQSCIRLVSCNYMCPNAFFTNFLVCVKEGLSSFHSSSTSSMRPAYKWRSFRARRSIVASLSLFVWGLILLCFSLVALLRMSSGTSTNSYATNW